MKHFFMIMTVTWQCFNSVHGQQLYSPDPWQLDHLDIPNRREEYVLNRVERLDQYACYPRNNGKYILTPKSTMRFNREGFPTYFREMMYGGSMILDDAIDWNRFHRKHLGLVEYYFTYNTSGKLEHISITEGGEGIHARMETEVSNSYDELDRLISQTVEDRYIYKPGFKYRGTRYPNDTSITVFSIVYSQVEMVEYIIRSKTTDPVAIDTLYKAIPLDQLFPATIGACSSTDTVEVNIPAGHAKQLNGGCDPMPSNMYTRYISSNGKHIATERVNKSTGHIQERWIRTYLDNGLYDATLHPGEALYWKAKYVYRE